MTANKIAPDRLMLEKPRLVLADGTEYEVKLLTIADELELMEKVRQYERESDTTLSRVENRLALIRGMVVAPDVKLDAALERMSVSATRDCVEWLEWASEPTFHLGKRQKMGTITMPDGEKHDVYEQTVALYRQMEQVRERATERERWEQDVIDGLADPTQEPEGLITREELHRANIGIIAGHIEGVDEDDLTSLPPMVRRNIEQNALAYLYGEAHAQREAIQEMTALIAPLWELNDWRQPFGAAKAAVKRIVETAVKAGPPR
jgi:hypothetical protein